jgi:hypothetical protein
MSRPDYREMTVALIRERTRRDPIQVAFLESARFYRLLRTHPEFERVFKLLEESKVKRVPVKVRVTPPNGDIIDDVREN